jgi:hypothetical protein
MSRKGRKEKIYGLLGALSVFARNQRLTALIALLRFFPA